MAFQSGAFQANAFQILSSVVSLVTKGGFYSKKDYEAYRQELERIIKISEKRFEKPEEAPVIVKAKIPPKVKKAVQAYNKAQPKAKRIDIDYGLEISTIKMLIAFFDALVLREAELQRLSDEDALILLMVS